MRIDTRIVTSLGEYMDCMSGLGEEVAGVMEERPPVLWFRGVDDIDYSLVPSLFRRGVRVEREKEEGNYSPLHYAEDIRTQHYIAKNYHFFAKEPSSRVEWLEVMQHHEMSTRVMDWSESSIHSLLFAVEAFFDKRRFHGQRRSMCVPCVWVLEPGKLNKKIFQYLGKKIEGRSGFIDGLLDELMLDASERNQIFESMMRFVGEKYNQTDDTCHIDYILNLSVLNDEILRDRSRIRYLLEKGDIMNPYYYILSRIYSDGHILADRDLPPLAVVHPYHSERIKAQKGVFTVFPYYAENENDKIVRKVGVNPDAMENIGMAEECLHKIVINNPQKIAYELLMNGMNTSWLYPEMPIVASEIENRRIYS